MVFEIHLALLRYKIADCGALCEIISFHIPRQNSLGDFFNRPNGEFSRPAPGSADKKLTILPGRLE
jgi:hypothetical protein